MAQVTTNQKMRKFLNDPENLVPESLAGLAAAHSDLLRYDAENQILVSKFAPKQGKVALISGGGSGHEPPPPPKPRRRDQARSPFRLVPPPRFA